jgi:hypothetical protein
MVQLNKNYKKCDFCGKRHIDIVMANVLKIMIAEEQISDSASIRQLGTPLITPAINLDKLPYLSEKTLVIITNHCNKGTSQKILEEVPEIKAIIKGNTKQIVGKLDESTQKNNYELLAGCDIRCDIQDTDIEPIILYKNQTKIHIEYPKKESPKIKELSQTLDKYENPTVLDAMCGPGTLGIYSLIKNADKVIFNDINNDSLNSLKVNLKINQISPEKYEIYNENLLDLVETIDFPIDIGIIDAFPGVNIDDYVKALEKICDDVVII